MRRAIIAMALVVAGGWAGAAPEESQAPKAAKPTKLPESFAGRRDKKLGDPRKGEHATLRTEQAVADGLAWLARHQAPDGSWSHDKLAKICSKESPCVLAANPASEHYDLGLTGIALLAFLGAGHGPDSTGTLGGRLEGRTAGEVVSKGVAFALAAMKADGSFGASDQPFMYNDAALTCALVEAHAMAPAAVPREKAQLAANFLVDAQRTSPFGSGFWGWRYDSLAWVRRSAQSNPAQANLVHDSDASATAWCVQALASARSAGLAVPDQSFAGAFAFVDFLKGEGENTGLLGYLDPRTAGVKVAGANDHFTYHPAVMSALGMVVRSYSLRDAKDDFLPLGAARLMKDLPQVGDVDQKTGDRLAVDYYYWYHGTNALMHLDAPSAAKRTGKYWKPWFSSVVAALLELQSPSVATPTVDSGGRPACRHGGWLVPDRWGSHYAGPIYQTALAVMTLEAPYRYGSALRVVKKT